MAVGMPVVTTALPEAKQYEGLVYYSNDYNEFFSNITRALTDTSPERREQRMALAKRNSWRERAQQIIHVMEQHLSAKGINVSRSLPDLVFASGGIKPRFGSYRINLAPFRQLIISRGSSYKFRHGSRTGIALGRRAIHKPDPVSRQTMIIKNRTAFRYLTERVRRSA